MDSVALPPSVPCQGTLADEIPFWACICLQERSDRYEMIKREFEGMGIAHRVHWHRPMRHPKGGRYGCFESHLEVFKAALQSKAPFAVVCEDDVRFSRNAGRAFEALVKFNRCGVHWTYLSLQNSGCEVVLHRDDAHLLPPGVSHGAFYFTRCYAITAEAMERAVAAGISPAHVDVALAVANWGTSFVMRPAAVVDVPSRSDNDWSEGGCFPWLAGQMQGVTHLPCVAGDRWKTLVQPVFWSADSLERSAWRRFMQEPGAAHHAARGRGPSYSKAATEPVGTVMGSCSWASMVMHLLLKLPCAEGWSRLL